MAGTLTICCLGIIAASVLGGLLPLATVLTHTRLQVYLSFSAGAMLGAAFFHMLPEAVIYDPSIALGATAVGLLALFFVERFFAFHHHEAPADPLEPCPIGPHAHAHHAGHGAGVVGPDAPGGPGRKTKGTGLIWQVAGIGLALHSLAGGLALASAAAIDARDNPWLAVRGVFLATIIHKPADALTIVSLMLRAGVPRWVAHAVNLGFSLMIPLGVLIFFWGLGHIPPVGALTVTSLSLAFSAGTFLCIALSDLLPELQFHAHDRVGLSIALLAGVILMAFAAMGE